MKKMVISSILFIFLAFLSQSFSQTLEQKIMLVNRLISKLQYEESLLKKGQKGVNGYAIYGLNCPNYLLTGNDLEDQFLSAKSRIRIIEKEIKELEILKKYLKSRSYSHKEQIRAVLRQRPSNNDYVGRYEETAPDGRKDYILELDLSYKGKTVKNIEVRNTNGQFSVWDTIPGNRAWALAVVKNGRFLSFYDSSIFLIPLTKSSEKLYLYLPDNGSILKGSTDYRVTVYFADGTSASCSVKKEF